MIELTRNHVRTVEFLAALLFVAFGATSCKTRTPSTPLRSADEAQEISCAFGDFDSAQGSTSGEERLSNDQWRIIASNALASKLAYAKADEVKETMRGWGYPNTDVIESRSMNAFVSSNENCVILAFRGTNMLSLRDWIVDFRIRQTEVREGAIHTGFYKAWTQMSNEVDRTLQRHRAAGKTLWVTGHSLGGALAATYGWDNSRNRLFRHPPKIARIVTFGQPLIADRTLAKYMRSEFLGRFYRVVNDLDLVTTQPHRLTHFGSLVWLREGFVDFRFDVALAGNGSNGGVGDISAAPIPDELAGSEEGYQELKDALDQIPAESDFSPGDDAMRVGNRPGALPLPKKITDHFMGGYIAKIKTAMFSSSTQSF